jgi:Holliday junction DNA helicase RuvA
MVLGYTQAEANRAVAAVYSDGMELEEIIRNALKGLMK